MTRDWEWMVYKPQSKDRLDFSACPRIAALKPPTNFNIEMLYNAAHFDVIASLNPTAILPSPELAGKNKREFIDLSY